MGMKAEGELRESMIKVASRAWIGWVVLYVGATIGTFFAAPHLFDGVLVNPLTWIAFLVLLAALIFIPVAVKGEKLGRAFVASAAALIAMIGLVGIGLFPNLVPASNDPALSLTIATHSSSERTLTTMLVIAGIGMPIVLAYTAFIYKTFKGKVQIGEDSY